MQSRQHLMYSGLCFREAFTLMDAHLYLQKLLGLRKTGLVVFLRRYLAKFLVYPFQIRLMFVLFQFLFELDPGNLQQMIRNIMNFWNLFLFLSRFNLSKIYIDFYYFLF